MQNHTPAAGGIPMVQIDGSKVRRLREDKGLTQLYVATVVGVTTDTISRWENKRYPNIKKENALKLAEALEVSLAEFFETPENDARNGSESPEASDLTEKNGDTELSLPVHKRKKFHYQALFYVAAAVILSVGIWFGYNGLTAPTISARRILPLHAPAGGRFPVLIEIEASRPESLSLILKEIVPKQCTPLAAVPPFTAVNKNTGVFKWISKTGSKKVSFSYLAESSRKLAAGEKLYFDGSVTMSKRLSRSTPVSGRSTMLISHYHWADSNGDGTIDDKEILSVYETFGSINGLGFDIDLIEDIWAASGYRWDGKNHRYIISH